MFLVCVAWLCSKASQELEQRAAAILAQAEAARLQATREERRAMEAEQRLMEDNTLEDEPDDMQGIRVEDKTFERADMMTGARVRGARVSFSIRHRGREPLEGIISPTR
jgi:hypothetical protein